MASKRTPRDVHRYRVERKLTGSPAHPVRTEKLFHKFQVSGFKLENLFNLKPEAYLLIENPAGFVERNSTRPSMPGGNTRRGVIEPSSATSRTICMFCVFSPSSADRSPKSVTLAVEG